MRLNVFLFLCRYSATVKTKDKALIAANLVVRYLRKRLACGNLLLIRARLELLSSLAVTNMLLAAI